jgi:hypothetical protein
MQKPERFEEVPNVAVLPRGIPHQIQDANAEQIPQNSAPLMLNDSTRNILIA